MNFLPDVNEKRWQCVSADVVTLHTGHWAGLWLVSSGGAGLWLAGRGLVTYRPRDNITTLISRHNCHEHRCHSAWRGPATLHCRKLSIHTYLRLPLCFLPWKIQDLTINIWYTKIDIASTMHLSVSWILILPMSMVLSPLGCWCLILSALFLRWWQNLFHMY